MSKYLFLFGCVVIAGCSSEVLQDSEDVNTVASELFVNSPRIWTSLSIPVCWDGLAQTTQAKRDFVKAAVTSSWQNNSQVKFTGWGQCASSTASGIHIKVDNSRTSNVGQRQGSQLNGIAGGMSLNMNMTAPADYAACSAQYGVDFCLKATAVHEFGHALGFAHEELRTDMPDWDCFNPAGTPGDTFVGTFDKYSIMNSCSTMVYGVATLSATDKLGLQSFYGNPTPSSFKKDAIGWDGENYYFFFGRNVTLFSIAADLIADYYPVATSSVFKSWPTTSPWTSGVDAALDHSSTKVYLFSGNQYLRLTKSTKTVDAGYPKTLPGGFSNWPATWTSVTAGLKMNGKLYLFRGSEYLRMTGTAVDAGYPKPISGNWNVGFTSNIDYGFVHPNGKGYFFKGQDYTRVTISANAESVDAGYPKKIVGRWKGITF